MIEFSELVIHVAHTPRTRDSAGAPPLGEGARSLWAPRGASHSYMRSSDLVHHLRRIRETHALRAATSRNVSEVQVRRSQHPSP